LDYSHGNRINVGDVVLISLRDFQDSKADIILKYTPDEARLLKSYGELAETVKINENDGGAENGEDGNEGSLILEIDVEFDIDDI
jgi:translation initiation factor 1A